MFLRRDQVSAVEVVMKSQHFSVREQEDMARLTAAGLVAHALASGDMSSVPQVLKQKGLDKPIESALRKM